MFIAICLFALSCVLFGFGRTLGVLFSVALLVAAIYALGIGALFLLAALV